MISRSRLSLMVLVGTFLALGLFSATSMAAAPAWVAVGATGPTVLPPTQSETQGVAVNAEGGTFTLTFQSATTAPIAFDASTSLVETALNSLSSIGGAGGTVSVAVGSGSGSYAVTFGGSLANLNVAQMTANGSSLTGTSHSVSVSTTVEGGPGTTKLVAMAQNVGGFSSLGTITYKVTLPMGVTTTATPTGSGWSCTSGAGQPEFTCTSGTAVPPSLTPNTITAQITAAAGAQSGVIHLVVSGGSAPEEATSELPLEISSLPASPGIQSFVAGAYDSNGKLDTRAGGHPFTASTGIFVNTKRSAQGGVVPAGEFRDISVDLPPGFLGNPIGIPQCPEDVEAPKCPLDTMAAIVQPVTGFGSAGEPTAVFNTEAPYAYPAKYKFAISAIEPLNVVGSLRSDADYGLTAASLNTPQILPVFGTFFTFWGSPADPSHDEQRCTNVQFKAGCAASDAPNTALLTNATNCSEQAISAPVTRLNVTLWQNPGQLFSRDVGIPPVTHCDRLHFEANFTFEPSGTAADSPASFSTSLTVPSEGLTNPAKLVTPEIKDTVVQLPEGVSLNASGADGLQACSESQIGLINEIAPQTGLPKPEPMPNPIRFNKDPNECPEASKIGTGELTTPLLAETLHGALYLAAQGNGNPFGSLFAVYLVIEDPARGIFIKLPGRVDPDPQTGQMKVTFQDLPQIPFKRLDLTLKGGDRSALASPTTCGNYVTTATNTPWSYPESGEPTVSTNGFEINQGPSGEACAQTPQDRPFNLGWNAGAEKTEAGASGPFDFQVTRPDGSQEIENLELKTPQGVSASLKGIPYCTEAEIKTAEQSTGKQEQEHPACPAASQVGTVQTGAGSGPTPFYTAGKLYLAGPYKGAPFSVVAITPAVAGPFDLGDVVVRSATFVDRSTAQVTAKTDPIPQILKGVVLRIRDVRIHLDRKDWAINPTSCESSSVKLVAHGNSGAVAERSARFQVGGCEGLGFKPKLSLKLSGGTKRNGDPALTATLKAPEGHYANIKDVQVTLPHSEFLEQAHINTVCTRVQATAHECPAGSIYGYAEAETPLLDGVLKGPVFLKSSVHKLPDLAIALRGPEDQPVEVEFAGRIDSVHARIRDTIEGLPDVPVSKFVLRMKGGKKGLLVNSRDLCSAPPQALRAAVQMTGQSNSLSNQSPLVGNSCGKKATKKRHKREHKSAQSRRISLGRLW